MGRDHKPRTANTVKGATVNRVTSSQPVPERDDGRFPSAAANAVMLFHGPLGLE